MIYGVAGEASADARGASQSELVVDRRHSVVIVGGGAAGIAVASSLLARLPELDISIIEPADVHYYQPGWTMVGGGVFDQAVTVRTMASVMPDGVHWIKAAVTGFEPELNVVSTDKAGNVGYDHLVVCPGLKLDWGAIDGLEEALGKNGVTSNYRFDLAPYTWALVQELAARGGKAVFTQPPMPIKCAGAPQKAMYLSADYWRRRGMLRKVDIEFCNAGAVLFGVADYVPALMEYVEKYGVSLNFGETLVKVNGKDKTAMFKRAKPDGSSELVERKYDMLHVVPPQKAPDFVSNSKLADSAGWVEVDPSTLQHKRFPNIHALGDVGGMSNAKTVAAARKQVPVVAHNVLTALNRSRGTALYDGYGSCPLTVERGKIVLAEFAYGGKVTPTFPTWVINGKRPSRLSWMLKAKLLPFIYWRGMLKGREWLVAPEIKG
ncbi:FAD/NAD(P)-binding oxidoreductase [Burkholderia orbicola]|uniref:NAD(P)/FAD-dependent oxidoreductase n=1 Tax=Burkholderia cepacia TaxID=292 RepID=UPI001CF43D71|nr:MULTISPECIES: FAD/NAD(P)-binding oxidoreductase [Burkholderia cepacia complex]MCA8057418.1 NAD(P)/FAD-dependent oxidoreductase [Burkholderia cepacia]MDN7535273.1 FAD/NAD(P)-binding oxidoreductase [Burkholderia orbicola]